MRWTILVLLVLLVTSVAAEEGFVELKGDLGDPYDDYEENFYSLTFLIGVILLFLVLHYGPRARKHKKNLFRLK